MTRRDWLALLASAPVLGQTKTLPTAPVAIAKCATYNDPDLTAAMTQLWQQSGAAGKVRNKTVTIKLNLTGSPGLRFQGKALGLTHYTHPRTLGVLLALLNQAGAKRVRLVESAWATAGPLEEYMLDAGWNVRQLASLHPKVEFANTNGRGPYKDYVRYQVRNGGWIFPAWDLNRAFDETDVLVSMAKLKNHDTCGVTLAMKNCFGNTPASIYGNDAGEHEPNESPTKGRDAVCHAGSRGPAKSARQEIDPASPRDPYHRMPRISVEVFSVRPAEINFIDGIETVTGGEGPWIKGLRHVRPGVLLMGTNGVTTDAVGTAVMGYNPRATKGTPPFQKCDNMLLLAEQMGLGTADLKQIEVRGTPIADALFPFPGSLSAPSVA